MRKVLGKWGLLALALSCCMSFNGSLFATQVGKSKVDTSKKVEIRWIYVGSGQETDAELVEKAINEYIEEHTELNCTVKLMCYEWGKYANKIEEFLKSGEDVDICFTSSWINDYYSHSDAFWNLDEALPTYAPKTKALLGEDFLKGAKINGKLYAIPCNKEKALQYGLLVREDLVKKYNMDLSQVKSLKDMEPFFATIKKNEPYIDAFDFDYRYNNILLRLSPYEFILNGLYPGAVKKNIADYKAVNQFTTDEAIALYRLMHEYYLKGYLRDFDLDNDYLYGGPNLEKGHFFAAIWGFSPGTTQQLEAIYGDKYISVPLMKPYMETGTCVGSMMAISKTSKNPERALMLLEQVNTDPALNNLINYGIEGLHYEVINEVGNTKIISGLENQSAYNPGIGWIFGNQMLNYLYINQAPNLWTLTESFNNEAEKSLILGFHFEDDNIREELAQCSEVYSEYVTELILGRVDPDTYVPLMKKAFKEAGEDKVLAEMQRQIDDWQYLVASIKH